MLTQRGYTNISIVDQEIIATKQTGQNIVLFLETIQQFNVGKYQEYVSAAEKRNVKHIIVITNKITPNIENMIRVSVNMDIKIETFYECELQYNITKHELVPLHTLLSRVESESMKEKYKASSFPVILKTDAISRFYNYSSGFIVKINRKNGDISFRIVK